MTSEIVAATPHARAVVDLDALAHNTMVFAAQARAGLMAVVKADGFGHGALPVARTVLAAGATWLGVTTLTEAMHLRVGGVTAPILSWLHGPHEDFRAPVRAGVDLSVSSPDHLREIARCAASIGGTAHVHLKADTGLHRNGAGSAVWPDLVRQARELELAGDVHVRGVWSHLISSADSASAVLRTQVRLFDQAVEFARDAGLRPQLRHLANSVATLAAPGTCTCAASGRI
jgi:alanine racemase